MNKQGKRKLRLITKRLTSVYKKHRSGSADEFDQLWGPLLLTLLKSLKSGKDPDGYPVNYEEIIAALFGVAKFFERTGDLATAQEVVAAEKDIMELKGIIEVSQEYAKKAGPKPTLGKIVRIVAAATVAALVLLGGWFYQDLLLPVEGKQAPILSQASPPVPQTPPVQSLAPEDQQPLPPKPEPIVPKENIGDLIVEAHKALLQDRLSKGVAQLHRVLELSPQNSDAITLLRDAVRRYAEHSKTALENNDLSKAERNLVEAKQIAKFLGVFNPTIEALAAQITLRKQIISTLVQARRALAEGRLHEAVKHVGALEALDQGNPESFKLLTRIVQRYVALTDAALQREDRQQAEDYLDQVSAVSRRYGLGSKEILALRQRLEEIPPPELARLDKFIGRYVAVTLKDGRVRRGTVTEWRDDYLKLSRQMSSMGREITTSTDIHLSELASVEEAVRK